MPEEAMLNCLTGIFTHIRNYLLTKGYKQTGILGESFRSGDISAVFDVGAEEKAIQYCKDAGLPVKIYTEETGGFDLASGEPEYDMFFDPVDGSTNFSKGIEGTGFVAAVQPHRKDGKIVPSDVEYALMGSIVSGAVEIGSSKSGVLYARRPFKDKYEHVKPSTNQELNAACVEIDMDFQLDETVHGVGGDQNRFGRILPLLYPQRKVKHVRRNGSAAMGLMNVPIGAVDAYIDLRDISSPENWIAAYAFAQWLGCPFTDPFGNDIDEIESMKTPYSYVFSANPELHEQILEAIDMG